MSRIVSRKKVFLKNTRECYPPEKRKRGGRVRYLEKKGRGGGGLEKREEIGRVRGKESPGTGMGRGWAAKKGVGKDRKG